jgi:hypothetical protein
MFNFSDEVEIDSSDIKKELEFALLIYNFPQGFKNAVEYFSGTGTNKSTKYYYYEAITKSELRLNSITIPINTKINIKLPQKSLEKGWQITPFNIRNDCHLSEENSKNYEISFMKRKNIYYFKKIRESKE